MLIWSFSTSQIKQVAREPFTREVAEPEKLGVMSPGSPQGPAGWVRLQDVAEPGLRRSRPMNDLRVPGLSSPRHLEGRFAGMGWMAEPLGWILVRGGVANWLDELVAPPPPPATMGNREDAWVLCRGCGGRAHPREDFDPLAQWRKDGRPSQGSP